LPETGEDEYYWSDLVGLRVINEQDENLGEITEMFETGAHDIMRVAANVRQFGRRGAPDTLA
jgi:16S rRNA processing protein RimM